MTRAFRRAPEWAGRGQDPPEHSRNDQNSPLAGAVLCQKRDQRIGRRPDAGGVIGAGEHDHFHLRHHRRHALHRGEVEGIVLADDAEHRDGGRLKLFARNVEQ